MTDEELNAIQKACDEATAAPWDHDPPGGTVTYVDGGVVRLIAQVRSEGAAAEDRRFIAGARSWVPALVAEIRALRADLDKQEEQYRKEFWDIFNAFTANAERLEAEGEKEAAIEWWAARKMLKNP